MLKARLTCAGRFSMLLCLAVASIGCDSAVGAEETFSSAAILKPLYDRSDLIIDATFLEDRCGGMSTSEIFQGKPVLDFVSVMTTVKIHRVIKGDVPIDEPLPIEGKLVFAIREEPVQVELNRPYFSTTDQMDGASSLRKGDRYILFLEDITKREPKAILQDGNGRSIRFRAFDPWLWRLPVTDAIEIFFDRMNKPPTR